MIANFLVEQLSFFMKTKRTHKLIQLDFDVSIVPTSDASGAAGLSDAMASLHVGNPLAHIVITVDGRNAVVFETKSGGLGPLQGDPWPLHKVWVPFSCSTGTIWPSLLQVLQRFTLLHWHGWWPVLSIVPLSLVVILPRMVRFP